MNFPFKASATGSINIEDRNQNQFSGWTKPNPSKAPKVLTVSQTDYTEKLLKENKSEKMNLTTIEDPRF